MATATGVLDRPTVTSREAGEVVTGKVLTTTPREIRVVIATDRRLRDGIALSMDGVRFRRGRRELPLVVGHQTRDVPIGKVVDIRTETRDGYRCLTGKLVFGASRRAKEIEADIRLGVITDLSVGFDIPDKSARDWRTGAVRDWLATELSVLAVGLDDDAVVYERARDRYGSPQRVDSADARRLLNALTLRGGSWTRAYSDDDPVEDYLRTRRVRALAEGRPVPSPLAWHDPHPSRWS